MKKGFIRVSKNAEQLQQEIKKLNQHGVPSGITAIRKG